MRNGLEVIGVKYTVELLPLKKVVWKFRCFPTTDYGASAHSENYLYVYGGYKSDHVSFSGCLHRLDTKTSFWTQLAAHSANSPMKK